MKCAFSFLEKTPNTQNSLRIGNKSISSGLVGSRWSTEFIQLNSVSLLFDENICDCSYESGAQSDGYMTIPVSTNVITNKLNPYANPFLSSEQHIVGFNDKAFQEEGYKSILNPLSKPFLPTLIPSVTTNDNLENQVLDENTENLTLIPNEKSNQTLLPPKLGTNVCDNEEGTTYYCSYVSGDKSDGYMTMPVSTSVITNKLNPYANPFLPPKHNIVTFIDKSFQKEGYKSILNPLSKLFLPTLTPSIYKKW